MTSVSKGEQMKTGWPPGLLQDDDRKLSRWLASRPDARYQLRMNMMYFNKHPDGSSTRKLVEDWTDEEKALDLRHKAFLKEAEELGYVVRLNTDTLKWEMRNT